MPTASLHVIELIGGYEPARTIILEALKAKKHVELVKKLIEIKIAN